MKKIYEFTIDKEEEVTEEEVIHEEDGATTTKTKKVKKFVPHKFFIRKATHAMMDDASLYYGVELAKAVKAGMLTESMLRKRFEEDGGLLNKSEISNYEKLYTELQDIIKETASISSSNKKITKTQQKKLDELEDKKNDLLTQIQDFENQKSSLFNQTAETRARNKLIIWWIVNLSYKTEDDKDLLMWENENIQQRINEYHEWYENREDVFSYEVGLKFLYYISFWISTSANSPEAFAQIAKKADEQINKEVLTYFEQQ